MTFGIYLNDGNERQGVYSANVVSGDSNGFGSTLLYHREEACFFRPARGSTYEGHRNLLALGPTKGRV